MKKFFGFVIKEIFHLTRDYRSMLILIGIPAIQLLLFGYVITNDIQNAKISVYDKSKDEMSRKLIDKIISSGYFKLEKNLNNYAEIEEDFKEGNIKQVIVIENDFSKHLLSSGKASIQIISDGSEPNTSGLLLSYIEGIISNFTKEINSSNQTLMIVPEIKMFYNPELRSVFMFVPGLIGMLLMMISAMMTSISITKEKETGTMSVLLVSPLKPVEIILGKVIPYIFLSLINVLVVVMLSIFVFDVPVRGSMFLLFAECLLYILVSLSLGILISSLTNSQQTAMTASLLGLLLPSLLLSGFIYPIENMPTILQVICNVVPTKWFIIILKNIMLQGNGIAYIWKETFILIGMMMIFIIISIKKMENIRSN